MAGSTATINTVTPLEPFRLGDDDGDEGGFSSSSAAASASALPPADHGRAAWLFVAASFMIEALVWGFALSFGIMQEYYSTHPPFAGSSNIATVGTTASGIMYFTAPLNFASFSLWPRSRQWQLWLGPFVIAIALIASSFATTVTQLILTQGVVYALGGNMIYLPAFSLLDEWFVQRKGLAFGIMLAGTGTAGVVMPLILSATLARYGHQIVLRGVALATVVLILPFLPFIKPRLPPSRTRRINLSFLRSPQYLIVQLANICQGLGYFIPGIYLPSYAAALGASPGMATLTLVVFNVACIAGCIVVGWLTDRLHPITVMCGIAFGAGIAVFVFWGLASGNSGLSLLLAFCAAYGLSAGGFSSSWPGMLRSMQRSSAAAAGGGGSSLNFGMAVGFLGAGRGIGNILSGPVSESLLRLSRSHLHPQQPITGYSGEFGPLIIFTGVTAVCSGFVILVRVLKPGFM